MQSISTDVKFRIMPSGDGHLWYWEVIHDTHTIVSRGLADTQWAARQEATAAARKANLMQYTFFQNDVDR